MKGFLTSAVKSLAALAGLRITRAAADGGLPPDFSTDDAETWNAVSPYTMTSPERVQALCEAVRYVSRAGIPGDFVECGVWKGGSMMAAARTLLKGGDRTRRLHLFDTFDGMTAPTAADVSVDGSAGDLLAKSTKDELVWARSPLDEVRRAVLSTGYDSSRVHFVQGRVEDTIPAAAPDRIALLRLDTDWYESTKHELEHLYPRLSPGGVLLIDDYGHWEGARKAVDEYIARHSLPLLLHRIDYTGRIAVKPAGPAGTSGS